jgi:hypothetical protein
MYAILSVVPRGGGLGDLEQPSWTCGAKAPRSRRNEHALADRDQLAWLFAAFVREREFAFPQVAHVVTAIA